MAATGNIRPYRLADRDWIIEVAAEVYRELGDYRAIIPPWLDHPGVVTWVEEIDAAGQPPARRGFVLLAFHQGSSGRQEVVVELIALAVAARHQHRGVGRSLLDHAIAVAELGCAEARSAVLMLTVSSDNAIGRRLYQTSGFSAVPGDHGCYDSGQPALRMIRPLFTAASAQRAG